MLTNKVPITFMEAYKTTACGKLRTPAEKMWLGNSMDTTIGRTSWAETACKSKSIKIMQISFTQAISLEIISESIVKPISAFIFNPNTNSGKPHCGLTGKHLFFSPHTITIFYIWVAINYTDRSTVGMTGTQFQKI